MIECYLGQSLLPAIRTIGVHHLMVVDIVVQDEETLIDEDAVGVTVSTGTSEVVVVMVIMSLTGLEILVGVRVVEAEVDTSRVRVRLGRGNLQLCASNPTFTLYHYRINTEPRRAREFEVSLIEYQVQFLHDNDQWCYATIA